MDYFAVCHLHGYRIYMQIILQRQDMTHSVFLKQDINSTARIESPDAVAFSKYKYSVIRLGRVLGLLYGGECGQDLILLRLLEYFPSNTNSS